MLKAEFAIKKKKTAQNKGNDPRTLVRSNFEKAC